MTALQSSAAGRFAGADEAGSLALCDTLAVRPQAAPTTPPVPPAECDGGFLYQQVTVSNPTKTLAFMVHLRLVKSDGEDVVPSVLR